MGRGGEAEAATYRRRAAVKGFPFPVGEALQVLVEARLRALRGLRRSRRSRLGEAGLGPALFPKLDNMPARVWPSRRFYKKSMVKRERQK